MDLTNKLAAWSANCNNPTITRNKRPNIEGVE